MELAEMVIAKEEGWRKKYPKFTVRRRFGDIAAKAAREDWKKNKPSLFLNHFITREVVEHIKSCKDLLNENKFAVDVRRCPMFCSEIESWAWKKKKPNEVDETEKPVDDFNHCMSNFRYAIENIKYITRRSPNKLVPKFGKKKHIIKNVAKSGAPRYVPRG